MTDPSIQDGSTVRGTAAWERKVVAAASGTALPALQNSRITQVIEAISPDRSHAELATAQLAAVETLAEIAPRNAIEAMLAGQMVATNDAAIMCFKRAGEAPLYSLRDDRDMRHALKLAGLYNRQVEVLAKVRQAGLFENHSGLAGADLPKPPETSEGRKKKLADVCEEAKRRHRYAC